MRQLLLTVVTINIFFHRILALKSYVEKIFGVTIRES